jgi:hypothetical protein
MKNNWTFIFIILLLLIFIFLIEFINKIDHFTLSKYRLIIVKNNNYILLHLKNINNNENKIYKIYKDKFII